MRTGNFLDLINPIFDEIRVGHDKALMKEYDPISKFYTKVDSSQDAYYDESGVSGIGDVPALGTGSVSAGSMYQMYDTRLDFKEYAVSIPISHTLKRFSKINLMKSLVEELTYAGYKRQITIAENNFINGWTATRSSNTGGGNGDGVSLFSASHPSTVPNVAVRSNTGTSALNATNVAATRLLGYQTLDENGQKMGNYFDGIACGLTNADTAYTIAGTSKVTGSGNNDLSANYGLDVDVFRYGDLGSSWFMYNTQRVKKDFKYIVFEAPKILEDFKIDLMHFYVTYYMNINASWFGWESVYGHNV